MLFNMQSKHEIELSSAAAAKSVYVGEHTALCRVLGHYKMYVDTRDAGIVPHLMMDGYWESWLTHAVSRMVSRRGRIVNVGASFGYYALLFADIVGREGKVVAFEPSRAVFRMLERSRAVNGFEHLLLHNCAITDKQEVVSMCHPPEFLNSRVIRPGRRPEAGEVVEEFIMSTTLDNALGGERADLVFVDAEGSEPEVWQGMARLRRENPELCTVLEFAPSRYADPMAFAVSLAENGRRLFVVREETGDLEIRTPEQIAQGERPGVKSGWGEEFTVVVQP